MLELFSISLPIVDLELEHPLSDSRNYYVVEKSTRRAPSVPLSSDAL